MEEILHHPRHLKFWELKLFREVRWCKIFSMNPPPQSLNPKVEGMCSTSVLSPCRVGNFTRKMRLSMRLLLFITSLLYNLYIIPITLSSFYFLFHYPNTGVLVLAVLKLALWIQGRLRDSRVMWRLRSKTALSVQTGCFSCLT